MGERYPLSVPLEVTATILLLLPLLPLHSSFRNVETPRIYGCGWRSYDPLGGSSVFWRDVVFSVIQGPSYVPPYSGLRTEISSVLTDPFVLSCWGYFHSCEIGGGSNNWRLTGNRLTNLRSVPVTQTLDRDGDSTGQETVFSWRLGWDGQFDIKDSI